MLIRTFNAIQHPSAFDRSYRRGLDVVPRLGRYYPQGIFHGFQEIIREAIEPARITALDEETMHVDMNHPFARFPFKVGFHLNRVLPDSDIRGGRCSSPLDELVRFPGVVDGAKPRLFAAARK